MKSAKLGAMFLIAIMALAGIGMGYAAWTDTITIDGTVNTGNVDIVVERYSGTWVYKDLWVDTIEIVDHDWVDECDFTQVVDGVTVPCTRDLAMGWMLIAYGFSDQKYDADGLPIDDAITITFGNLFPCIDFVADVLFHYDGSIPVKIQYADFDTIFGLEGDVPDWLYDLWDMYQADPAAGYGIWVEAYRWDPETGEKTEEIVDIGTQLHYCDWVILELYIHLPQFWPGTEIPTDDLMDRNGGFTAHIEVIQWNEFAP